MHPRNLLLPWAIAGVLAGGCSFLMKLNTRPIERDSQTLEMPRPVANQPVDGGRMLLWNMGQVLPSVYGAAEITSPPDIDRRDNTITLASYVGTKLCFRIEDHLMAGAGNAYEVSPLQLVTSTGTILDKPSREREASEMVPVDMSVPDEYGVLVNESANYTRYVTRVCFSGKDPIITDDTTFVRLEMKPETRSMKSANTACCKFTFAFGGGGRVATAAPASWKGAHPVDLTTKLQFPGTQPAFNEVRTTLFVAEVGAQIGMKFPDWPDCMLQGTRDGDAALITPGQVCTRTEGRSALRFTVVQGILTFEGGELGVLVTFSVEGKSGRKKVTGATAEIIAKGAPR
jgi:hypothetical protein